MVMKKLTHIFRLCTAVISLAAWTPVQAQLTLVANDTQVNTTTTARQARPVTAQAGNGQGIIAWECQQLDGDGFGIAAQLFSAPGTLSGTEFQLNPTATGNQRFPSAAMADDGKHAIVWMSQSSSSANWQVLHRYFDASGTALTSEANVSSSGVDGHRNPAVAMDHDGDHVVVWMNNNLDISARLFTNAGAASGSDITVNDSTSGFQGYPAVAMDSAGNHVIVWQSNGTDGDGNGIFAKVYDNSGNVTVNQFQVNTTAAGNQQEPSVGMDGDGNFVISWSSWDATNNVYQVMAQRFAANGTAQGSEFAVSDSATISHDHSHVAMTQEGTFVIGYSSFSADGEQHGVYVQAYKTDGTANGAPTLVNTETASFQHMSHMAWSRDSLSAMIAWQSGDNFSSTSQDGDDYGIYTTIASDVDEAPIAICQDITLQLDANGTVAITAQDVDNGSSDDNGIASMTIDASSYDCNSTGSHIVTLTVTDGIGLSSSCTSNVTVEDASAPVVACRDLTLYLDANGSASTTTGDVDNGTYDNCSFTSSLSASSFDCNDIGIQAVTFTAIDPSNNSDSCTAKITVQDSSAPALTCNDIQVSLDGTGLAVVSFGDVLGSISDNCGIATTDIDVTNFDCSNIGANTVNLTATDDNGNVSTCAATVTIVDDEIPSIMCNNITLSLDASGSASTTAAALTASSNDNCGVSSITASQTSFGCTSVGNNTVTLTVTDASGNLSTCDATVTVEDNIAPSITCNDVTIALDGSGTVTTSASALTASSSDNCAISSTTASQTSFSCTELGNNTVTLTATDGSGNSSTCTATVTVEDNTAPILTCNDITVSLDATGAASTTVAALTSINSDNCGIASTTASQTSFDCGNLGSNVVTVTSTDVNGNTSTCNATVTVQDVSGPSITCNNITLTLNGSGTASTTVAALTGSVSDNCGVSSTTASQTNFGCTNLGSNNITLAASDVNGNSSTCTATVTVQDVTAPSISCNDMTLSLNGSGSASTTVAALTASSSDNCGISSTTASQTSFSCSDIGTNTVTLTATDYDGNQSTCTANVTVEDNTAPSISCPSNTTYSCIANIPDAVASDVTASDNCGSTSISISVSNPSGSCSNGTYLENRTFTATDGFGNQSSCTQQVAVAVPTKIVIGDNVFCIAKVRIFPNCSNPNSVQIKSSQKINKVTLVDQNGTQHVVSGGGKDITRSIANGLIIKKVWVKSGCSSTNSNGFTHTVNFCNGSSKDAIGFEMGEDIAFGTELKMETFPNPTTGHLNVQVLKTDGSNGNYNVQVIDMQGRTLIDQPVEMQGGYIETDLELGAYANGLYYIVLDGNDERLMKKVIKQ